MATAFSERLDLELCSIYSINSFHAFHATRIDIPGRTNEQTKGNTWGQRKKKGGEKTPWLNQTTQITIEKNKREREKKRKEQETLKKSR